jgi:hypothetical protein
VDSATKVTVAGQRRTPGRRRAVKALFVGALALHLALLVHVGNEPHKLFGFRPFNESDSWQAEIVRIDADGIRRPIDDGTWPYDWDDVVANNKLRRPATYRHANAGASATLDFLQRALDWVVDRTPDDPDTIALEVRVTVYRNGRGPEEHVLTSRERGTP